MVGTFYKVRYKGPGGNQVEESGFLTQDEAIDRLTNTYKAKKASPANQARSERIEKYGQMRLREYTAEWRAGQRHLAAASLSHLDSLLQHHVFPALATRRMSAFDHKVVDGFIRTMERNGVGLAAQSNAYDKLKSIWHTWRRPPMARLRTWTVLWPVPSPAFATRYVQRHDRRSTSQMSCTRNSEPRGP
ncbi:hypothetical protein ACIOG8_34505 [Streptomyces erythrochromogenes]|uniref:hypothetical protein n=1 Tax=Streptomyces erythrochromogenes TaxID=285574 RepID=UPI0037FCDEBC